MCIITGVVIMNKFYVILLNIFACINSTVGFYSIKSTHSLQSNDKINCWSFKNELEKYNEKNFFTSSIPATPEMYEYCIASKFVGDYIKQNLYLNPTLKKYENYELLIGKHNSTAKLNSHAPVKIWCYNSHFKFTHF